MVLQNSFWKVTKTTASLELEMQILYLLPSSCPSPPHLCHNSENFFFKKKSIQIQREMLELVDGKKKEFKNQIEASKHLIC